MAETYYIRLPFYLLNGSTTRTVDITFDGTLISTTEVSAANRASMTTINFLVNKDPGTYLLKITPKIITDFDEGLTSVCLDDIWVSNNNVDFRSVLLNGNLENITKKVPDDDVYGFNPAVGASLYNDIEMSIEIDLPDSTSWNSRYPVTSSEFIKNACDNVIANGTEEEKLNLLPKMQQTYELFKARGY